MGRVRGRGNEDGVFASGHAAAVGVAAGEVGVLEGPTVGPVEDEIVEADDACGAEELQVHEDGAGGVADVEGGDFAGGEGDQTRGADDGVGLGVALGGDRGGFDCAGGTQILHDCPHGIPSHIAEGGHGFLGAVETDIVTI